MIARVCTRRGWTLAQWLELDTLEQEFWIGYEQSRLDDVVKLKEAISEQKALDGSAYALIRLLTDLV